MDNGKFHLFGKVLISEEDFYDLTHKLKKALPEDLKKADKLSRDSDRVVSGAHSEAQRLLGEAQGESQRVVGDARSQADRTIADSRSHSERIIEDARREAERIVADAQQHAEQLVAENTITQRAQQFSEATHNAALHESEEMRHQADNYAFEVLEKVELVMHKLLHGVEQGKEQINENRR